MEREAQSAAGIDGVEEVPRLSGRDLNGALLFDTTYTLTVNNVQDLNGRTILPDSQIGFVAVRFFPNDLGEPSIPSTRQAVGDGGSIGVPARQPCEGPRIRLEDLPSQVREPGVPSGLGVGDRPDDGGGSGAPWGALDDNDLAVKRRSAELERQLIQTALRRTGGHRGKSAALLDLSDRALRYKIREYGLE